jgi:hypothetical protein
MQKEPSSLICEGELKSSQIVVFALIMGIASFLFVCLVLFFINRSNIQPPNVDPHNFLTIAFVFALISFTGYLSAMYVPEIIIKKQREKFIGKSVEEINSSDVVQMHRNHLIVKLALLESSALAGLILFLLTILNDLIYAEEEYWLALIPALFFFYNAIVLFPTREKISDFVKINFS